MSDTMPQDVNRQFGPKRKTVDDYAAMYLEDLTVNTIIKGGQEVRVLVCRFCYKSIAVRTDRIKDHISSIRHQRLKLEALKKPFRFRQNVTQGSDAKVAGLLPGPPMTMRNYPGVALEESDGRPRQPVTPEDINWERELVMPTSSTTTTTINLQKMYLVKWRKHDSNHLSMFSKFLSQQLFVDVSLRCQGKTIKCHKIVLSSNSVYFEKLLTENSDLHPIIFLKDMRHWELEALVEFMYSGEVRVQGDKIQSLINAGKSLEIKGLYDPCEEDGVSTNEGQCSKKTNVSDNSMTYDSNIHSPIANLPFGAINDSTTEHHSVDKLALGSTFDLSLLGFDTYNNGATLGTQGQESACAPEPKRRKEN